jgi:hypothetical protein
MTVIELQPRKPATTTISLTFELPAETAALLNKFVLINQHTNDTHGPMGFEKLAKLWFEDVAAAVKDDTTWQGGHAALVLGRHGYRT